MIVVVYLPGRGLLGVKRALLSSPATGEDMKWPFTSAGETSDGGFCLCVMNQPVFLFELQEWKVQKIIKECVSEWSAGGETAV